MNTEKIDFALKNGTPDQRREVLDGIYKINLVSEAIWHESQNNQNPVLKPNTTNNPLRENQPKDSSSYKLIFKKMKEMIPKVDVKNCMSDYESATRKAIREVFPNCRLSGCYFHYVQAMIKKFAKFGLNDDKFSSACAQVCALALLPNEDIINGFEIICKGLKSQRWNRFKKYWLRYWSKANISVYGLKDRTNNFAESQNHTLNVILKSRHPDIWTLVVNLKTIESNKSDELRKVMKGHMPRKKKGNTKVRILNEKIKSATKYFKKTGRVKKFLMKVTFQENFESYFRIRIGNGTDDDDDGDDDDEFVANDFNEKCNFNYRYLKQKKKRGKKSKKTIKKAEVARKESTEPEKVNDTGKKRKLDSDPESSSVLAAEGAGQKKGKRTMKQTKVTTKESMKPEKVNDTRKKRKLDSDSESLSVLAAEGAGKKKAKRTIKKVTKESMKPEKVNGTGKKRNLYSERRVQSSVLAADGVGGKKSKRTIKKAKVTRRESIEPVKVNTEKSRKKHESQVSQSVTVCVGVANMRNLMQHSTKYILTSFSDHEVQLRKIYNQHIKHMKSNYKSKDLPDMIELDIMSEKQLKAMASLAEKKFAKEDHHNSTDVIFDAILPEWALAQFCKEFNCSRTEAIIKIQKQNQDIIEKAD